MPIRINGTTVNTNRVNGTSISRETVNGTQVYGGTAREWSFYGYGSSDPYTSYYVTDYNSSNVSTSAHLLETAYPASYYATGTTGTIYYAVPMEYAIFVVRSL